MGGVIMLLANTDMARAVPPGWELTAAEALCVRAMGGYCFLLVEVQTDEGAKLRSALMIYPEADLREFLEMISKSDGVTPMPFAVRFLDSEDGVMKQGFPTITHDQIVHVFSNPPRKHCSKTSSEEVPMPPLELTEKTTLTILDLGNSNIAWSPFANGRLGHNLKNDQGECPEGFIGYPARYLVIVGRFTHKQVETALKAQEGLAPYFTLEVIVGKTAMEEYIASQPPEGAMEVTADTPDQDVSRAIQTHGG